MELSQLVSLPVATSNSLSMIGFSTTLHFFLADHLVIKWSEVTLFGHIPLDHLVPDIDHPGSLGMDKCRSVSCGISSHEIK